LKLLNVTEARLVKSNINVSFTVRTRVVSSPPLKISAVSKIVNLLVSLNVLESK
jgi:hypothetical protein